MARPFGGRALRSQCTGDDARACISGYVALEAWSAAARFAGSFYSIAASLFCPVQGFVGGLDHLFHFPRLRARFRDSDADGDRESAGSGFRWKIARLG